MLKSLLYVAVGGALGASLRYGITLWHPTTGFPWATLISNALGCFLFGLVISIGQRHPLIGRELATFLLTGFLGGLTTFSSLINDTHTLMTGRAFALAAANIAGQLLVGLLCLRLGSRIALTAAGLLGRLG